MRTSNAKKGSYYKQRTKEYFERRGYVVAFLERMMWLRGRPDEAIARACAAAGLQAPPSLKPVKQDQFASDLLAMKADELIFIQVKGHTDHTAAAVRAFLEFPCPPFAKQWVVMWEPRAREPIVVDVRQYMAERDAAMPNRPRKPEQRLPFRGTLPLLEGEVPHAPPADSRRTRVPW
jgi:hypothetical protein